MVALLITEYNCRVTSVDVGTTGVLFRWCELWLLTCLLFFFTSYCDNYD